MSKALLYTCGAMNAVFTLFHIYLAKMIAAYPVAEGYRALMQALNLGGILMIAFLAFAFLVCQRELDGRLGRSAILLGAVLYLTRGAGEFVFFPQTRPLIVVVCVLAGLLHLAALLSRKPTATHASPRPQDACGNAV